MFYAIGCITNSKRERDLPHPQTQVTCMIWFILTCMIWFILTCMVWFILTCMVWFIHQNVLLIISTWQWANCSIFVIVICPLLPHSSAQAEGEDDGEELGGGYDHQRTYHQVQVAPHQVGELGAAPSGEVGVGLVGSGCTGGVRGAQQEGGRLTEYSRTQEPGTKYKYQEQLNENTVQHLSYKTFGWYYTDKIKWNFILSGKTVPPVCVY